MRNIYLLLFLFWICSSSYLNLWLHRYQWQKSAQKLFLFPTYFFPFNAFWALHTGGNIACVYPSTDKHCIFLVDTFKKMACMTYVTMLFHWALSLLCHKLTKENHLPTPQSCQCSQFTPGRCKVISSPWPSFHCCKLKIILYLQLGKRLLINRFYALDRTKYHLFRKMHTVLKTPQSHSSRIVYRSCDSFQWHLSLRLS